MTAAGAQALWTSDEAIAATNGHCAVPWQASGVSIDSRTIQTGDLFVALQGPHHDGHDYVDSALQRNAAAAMVHAQSKTLSASAPLLMVDDTMTALQSLGAASRDRSAAKIIAVTGSVGKTGVKEALKFVLSEQGETHASVGSFNNHWGVPLSLARMAKEAAYGVFEIGMNHPGEIEPLSGLVRPHVAVITTVEAVHSEFFKTTEAIAHAKAEIFAGVMPGGTAVLNHDNPYFDLLTDAARNCGINNFIAFGQNDRARVRLLDAVLEHDKSVVMAEVDGHALTYHIGIPGRHWVMNSLCVLASVLAAGGDVVSASVRLAALQPAKGRGQIHHVAVPGGEVTIIDESYNASPVSMKAALAVLGGYQLDANGRRIAVLGDMLELGAQSAMKHQCLLTHVLENDINLAFTAGPEMSHLAEALPNKLNGGHAENADQLTKLVTEAVAPGDVITVKGSAGSRMGVIVEALLALQADQESSSSPQRAVNGG